MRRIAFLDNEIIEVERLIAAAGASTSCAFALNVRDAYAEAPGAVATVRVYSPVTDTTYTMDCRPSGSGITCSGGNGASVSF